MEGIGVAGAMLLFVKNGLIWWALHLMFQSRGCNEMKGFVELKSKEWLEKRSSELMFWNETYGTTDLEVYVLRLK